MVETERSKRRAAYLPEATERMRSELRERGPLKPRDVRGQRVQNYRRVNDFQTMFERACVYVK